MHTHLRRAYTWHTNVHDEWISVICKTMSRTDYRNDNNSERCAQTCHLMHQYNLQLVSSDIFLNTVMSSGVDRLQNRGKRSKICTTQCHTHRLHIFPVLLINAFVRIELERFTRMKTTSCCYIRCTLYCTARCSYTGLIIR